MTPRTEKPSQHESSTDTLISALGKIAKQLEENDYAASLALLEAAQRLDKLEKELEDMRVKQKTLRDEFAMSALGDLIATNVNRGVDTELLCLAAYSFADAMMEARK